MIGEIDDDLVDIDIRDARRGSIPEVNTDFL